MWMTTFELPSSLGSGSLLTLSKLYILLGLQIQIRIQFCDHKVKMDPDATITCDTGSVTALINRINPFTGSRIRLFSSD